MEVLDTLDYHDGGMALEGELQCLKSKCMLPSSNNKFEFVCFSPKQIPRPRQP